MSLKHGLLLRLSSGSCRRRALGFSLSLSGEIAPDVISWYIVHVEQGHPRLWYVSEMSEGLCKKYKIPIRGVPRFPGNLTLFRLMRKMMK